MLSPLVHTQRLAAAFEDLDVDLMLVRSGENFTYLSGVVYPGTLARHLDLTGSTRAAILLVARDLGAEVFLNDFAAGFTRLRKADLALTLYEGYREDPYEALARHLAARGFARARIGYEANYVGDGHMHTLRTAMPDAVFVDCTAALERARWVKTAAEVALFERAGSLLDDVYRSVFATIRPGDTERSVHARMMAACLEAGFEYAHGILNTHRNPVIYAGESDARFEAGDVVRTDYVAYLSGYPGHQSRNATLGRASDDIVRTYRKVRDVYGLLMEAIRPGVPVDDLYRMVAAEYRARGLTYQSLLVGHSVGAWFHQQEPILRRDSPHTLEEGMVLALEPYYESFHIQDLVLVTATGHRLLTPDFDTREMFEIGI
jgi:Xaa-Pro aminopeptidase